MDNILKKDPTICLIETSVFFNKNLRVSVYRGIDC
jgi:hypothetical protein